MKFDKNRLMYNINCLIRDKGIKVGTFENEIGVSTGYLSRISKADNESVPGIDLIYKIAQKLEVSVDSLITGDFDKANDNVLYITKFISALTQDTDSQDIEWEKFKAIDEVSSRFGLPDIAIVKKEKALASWDNSVKPVFHSYFEPDANLLLAEDNFLSFIEGIGTVLLFHLYRMEDDTKKISVEVELYSLIGTANDGDGLTPLCSTLVGDGALTPCLFDLYNCIDRHDRDIKVNNRARVLINSYMDQRKPENFPFI